MIASRSILAMVFLFAGAAALRASEIGGEAANAAEAPPVATSSLDLPPSSDLERLRQLEAKLVETVDRVMESVVFIQGGSGFLVSEDGYVLTNEHVVMGRGGVRKALLVKFRRGKHLLADLVGHDPGGDLALLKLREPPGRPHLTLGDSDRLEIGQPVIAVGDPFLVGSQELFLKDAPPDYEPAVSFGIVSAVHRYSHAYPDSIQVDAAVNPGNSGGPLLSLDGKVVGINGKIENPFGVGINAGVGYAIPSNQIRRFLEPLKRAGGGAVRHGRIHGLHVGRRVGSGEGLPIVRVDAKSPADRYGFRAGDRLVSIDGLRATTENRFHGIIGTYPAGSWVTVRVLRDDHGVELKAALYEGAKPYLGLQARTVVDPVEGVVIDEIVKNGPAAVAGLQPEDVIRTVAMKSVMSTVDLTALLKSYHPGDLLELQVVRDGKPVTLELRLGSRAE